jgi:hypothetical protein
VFVELALDPSFPRLPFVKLVENHERLAARPLGRPYRTPILTIVPAQVDPGTHALQNLLREGRLADLTRASHEDHLVLEIREDSQLEITPAGHGQDLPEGKKRRNFICLSAYFANRGPDECRSL